MLAIIEQAANPSAGLRTVLLAHQGGWVEILLVAGLAAEGETLISGVHHIDRGYDDLVGRLAAVGASIERVQSSES